MATQQAFFRRTSPTTFEPSEHASGAWSEEDHHFASIAGLVVHELERFRSDQGDSQLQLGRISYDILGRLPMSELTVDIEVLRPGRTIELLQATVTIGGRAVVIARAWYLSRADTADVVGGQAEPMPSPEEVEPWEMSNGWPGGYIAQIQARVVQQRPGRATVWLHSPMEVVAGEVAGDLARFFSSIDAANGIAVRQPTDRWTFPNVDLTVHLHRVPEGTWTGLDTEVIWGPDGVGLTSSTLHDARGPVGTAEQILTLRRL
ncbi:thioesterase family protein [Kocuria palustris]|uniref:thioesterase family protein n=1 Tax=Kocuria palustris TaxID=71999 RepID=UPI00077B740C|nr:thioesterase family protein [Kocuria palustris]